MCDGGKGNGIVWGNVGWKCVVFCFSLFFFVCRPRLAGWLAGWPSPARSGQTKIMFLRAAREVIIRAIIVAINRVIAIVITIVIAIVFKILVVIAIVIALLIAKTSSRCARSNYKSNDQ